MNKKMMLIIIIVAVILIGAIVFGFIDNSKATPANNANPQTQTPPATSSNAVSISNFSFSPATLTIKAGQTVMWQNNDSVPHSVVGSVFKSSTIKQGEGFGFTFSQPGEYNYNCGLHPSMQGKIIVE